MGFHREMNAKNLKVSTLLFIVLLISIFSVVSSPDIPIVKKVATIQHSYYVLAYYNPAENKTYGIIIQCNYTAQTSSQARTEVIEQYRKSYEEYKKQRNQNPNYASTKIDSIRDNLKEINSSTKCSPLRGGSLTFGYVNPLSNYQTPIPNCKNIDTGADRLTIGSIPYPAAVCDIPMADRPFSSECTQVIVYSENTNTPTLPGYQTVCPENMAEQETHLSNFKKTLFYILTMAGPSGSGRNEICVLAGILLGILFANMYITGKNPLALLDLTVPHTVKPKGWTQINPIVVSRSYGELKGTSKKVMKSSLNAIEKAMKIKRKNLLPLKGDKAVLEAIRFLARQENINISDGLKKATKLNGLSHGIMEEIGKILGIVEKNNRFRLKLNQSDEEAPRFNEDFLLASKIKEYLEHWMHLETMGPMGGKIGGVSTGLIKMVNGVLDRTKMGEVDHINESIKYFPTTMIRTGAIGARAMWGLGKSIAGMGAIAIGKGLTWAHSSKGAKLTGMGNRILSGAGFTMGRLYPVLDKMKETYKQEMDRDYDLLVMMVLRDIAKADKVAENDVRTLLENSVYESMTNKKLAEVVNRLITTLDERSMGKPTDLGKVMSILRDAQEKGYNSRQIYEQIMSNSNLLGYTSAHQDIYTKLTDIYEDKDTNEYQKLIKLYAYEYYGKNAWINTMPLLDREHTGNRTTKQRNGDMWTTLIFGNLLHKYGQGDRIGVGGSLGEVFSRMFNYTFGLGFEVDGKGGFKLKFGEGSGYYNKDKENLKNFIKSNVGIESIRTAAKGLYQNLTDDGKTELANSLGISTGELAKRITDGKLNPIDLVNVLYREKDIERYLKTDMSGQWHNELNKGNSYTTAEQVFNKGTYGKYGQGRLTPEQEGRIGRGETAREVLMKDKTDDIALNFMNGTLGNLYDGQFRRRVEFDAHAVIGTLAHMIKYDESIPENTRAEIAEEIMGIFTPNNNQSIGIDNAYDSLTSGSYRAGLKDQEFMERLQNVLGNNKIIAENKSILDMLENHIKNYNVSYMDTVRHPYIGLNEGTFVPFTKGTPVSDYDLVVGGRLAIKDKEGRYYEFDPDAVTIDYGDATEKEKKEWNDLYNNIITDSNSLEYRKDNADTLIEELGGWLKEASNEEYLKRAYTFSKVVHDLSESLNDPTLMNLAPTTIREHYEVRSHSETNFMNKWAFTPGIPIPYPKTWRDSFLNQIAHRGLSLIANSTLYATQPLTHALYGNVAISEQARQTSFNNMSYIRSLTRDDWNRIHGGNKEYRDALMSSANDFFPYYTSWSQVIDRDPRNSSTSHSIQNSLSGFFNFGPSRNFSLELHERGMINPTGPNWWKNIDEKIKWWKTKYIEYPWGTEYAGHKLSSLTNTFRTIQQAMQGYPGRWDVANPNNPFMARGYYTPIRIREALNAFSPAGIDESGELSAGVFAKAISPFGGDRSRQTIMRSAMFKFDSMLGFKSASERADLSGIRMMNGLKQSPHEVMHIFSGIDANARVGDANPGVSYYDPYHRLKSDTNVSQYLAYEFGGYSGQRNFSGYFRGNQMYASAANTPIIKRDKNITAETLLSYREHELKNFGFWRNPVYGWFSPAAFAWHNPFVSSVSGRTAVTAGWNITASREGRAHVLNSIRNAWTSIAKPGRIRSALSRNAANNVKYCPQCGAKILKGTTCPRCGYHLHK